MKESETARREGHNGYSMVGAHAEGVERVEGAVQTTSEREERVERVGGGVSIRDANGTIGYRLRAEKRRGGKATAGLKPSVRAGGAERCYVCYEYVCLCVVYACCRTQDADGRNHSCGL